MFSLKKWKILISLTVVLSFFYYRSDVFAFDPCTPGTCPDGSTTGIASYTCSKSSYGDYCVDNRQADMSATCTLNATAGTCQACAVRGTCKTWVLPCITSWKTVCVGCCPGSGGPGSGGYMAKGLHVDSTCTIDENGRFRIRSWGWACDQDDYSKKTAVHMYMDNSKNFSYIIGDGTADNANDYGGYSSCGNTPNHGFDITSYSSYTVPSGGFIPAGTHNAFIYVINDLQSSNPLASGTPKLVNCIACTVNQGTLSSWGSCVNGKQTRTCNGATCCPSGCTPGTTGCACGNCNGAPLERSCLRLEGVIWSDFDQDGVPWNDPLESWGGTSVGGLCSPQIYSGFSLQIQGMSGNRIKSWWCHSTNKSTYYATAGSSTQYDIKPESTIPSVTLNPIPVGYKCGLWQYMNQENGGGSGIVSGSGIGCTTSNLLMPSAGWVNLHWRLDQQKYTLKLKVKKIPVELTDTLGLCSSSGFNGFENMSGADVTIKDSSGSTTLCQGISDSNGEFSCPIWTQQGTINIYVSKTVGGDTPETYTMKCPANSSYTYTPSPPPSEGQTINLNIGLQTIYKKGWVSAIDADIFANNLNVVVPDGPTDNSSSGQIYNGFAKTLINSSSNNNNTLGFVFSHSNNKSNPDVDRPCPNRKGFETNTGCGTEYGGYAYDLMHSSQDHKSIWLENFSFSPPSSAKKISSLPTTFNSGSIYSISSSVFNNRLKSEAFSYSIIGDGGNGMSVLYIDGNANILNPITTSSSGRLLLVVDGSLTVGSSVGSVMDSFSLTQNPNIMAGIISSGQVTIASIGGTISDSHFDKPIMLTAPFVSKTGISFGRDLYHDNNAKLPAEAVNFFGKYLYYISNLEKTKSADYLYYTGVSTYDISWEYIY